MLAIYFRKEIVSSETTTRTNTSAALTSPEQEPGGRDESEIDFEEKEITRSGQDASRDKTQEPQAAARARPKRKSPISGTQAKRPIDVHLRSLLQAIPDVVYFKDAEGRNLIVNKAFEKFAGRKSKDIIGRTDDELLPPELAAKCRRSDEAAIISRVPVRFEEDSTGPEGDLRFYETIKSAIFDGQGKVVGLVGISRDITERKTWEERLAESEERFRGLFENATVGLYRTTPGGRIILANPTLVRMLGYSHFKQLSVRNLKETGFEPSYPRLQFIQRIEKENEIKGLVAAWKRRDGTTVFVRESAKAIRDVDGRTLYYEGTVEDITEQKERNRSSKRANTASGRSSKPPRKPSS